MIGESVWTKGEGWNGLWKRGKLRKMGRRRVTVEEGRGRRSQGGKERKGGIRKLPREKTKANEGIHSSG